MNIGRISYLNVLPVFALLKERLGLQSNRYRLISGHPNELNNLLARGDVDVSPSSSFEYLARPEAYRLLPGAGISSRQEVQSVVLATPVPTADLAAFMASEDAPLQLTTASATSSALVRILWRLHWNLPEPNIVLAPPGTATSKPIPSLEIGDHALRLTLNPPKGWVILDLGREWRAMTGLPFVFAVWIVRRGLMGKKRQFLEEFSQALTETVTDMDRCLATLARHPEIPDWLSPQEAETYWRSMAYGLGPDEMAGLVVFGALCRQLGLIPTTPALSWWRDTPPSRGITA